MWSAKNKSTEQQSRKPNSQFSIPIAVSLLFTSVSSKGFGLLVKWNKVEHLQEFQPW